MLAEFNAGYKDASEFSDWMPPDGEYLVTILKCDKGVKIKDNTKTGWWKLTGRIEAPENEQLNGQEFALGFYRTAAMGILKGQARALNGGVTIDSLAAASQVFEQSPGKIVRITVRTTAKEGKSYTNCYVKEVLHIQDAGGNVEPPQG